MDLLEREGELETLRHTLDAASSGAGSVVAISGEAGIGKTELVRRFAADLGQPNLVLWGGCDDLSTPRTLGPFRDIAIQSGGALKDLLTSGAPRGDVLDAVYELLDSGRPATVAVVEDVHWADGASLDVIKFLGRRILRMRCVLIITYRSEEVMADHPLQAVIGDIPPAAIHRIGLSPLSRAGVEALASSYTGSTDELYEATAGNPFLVSEALATPGTAASAGVRDAVRARASRLSDDARDLAELVSVVPTQVERTLVEAIFTDVDEGLESCRRRGLLRYDESWVWYRHELARAAIHDSLSEQRRRSLNSAVLSELIASSADLARIVHHARQASNGDALRIYAPAAGRQAAAAESHREALIHFRVAVSQLADMEPEQQAQLLSEYAVESYLVDEVGHALQISDDALELWQQLGNAERQGDLLRWQSRFHWWLGHAEEARKTGEAAVAVLETVPDSPGLPMAYSNLAQLAMLAQDTSPAVTWSEKAIAAAEAAGDNETLSHALNNLGSAQLRVGDTRGFDLLARSLDVALCGRFDDHAGRAYANLIWTELDYRLFDAAEQHVSDGIEFTLKRDLSGSLHYITAERGALRLARGQWADAEQDLRWVLSQPEVPGITQMPAAATLARLAARRGDPDAADLLTAAWELAEPTGELQRLAPVASAQAEWAWLKGKQDAIQRAVADVYQRAVSVEQPWVTDELAFWMWRSGDSELAVSSIETPYAMQINGQWLQAAAAWADIGCPYERATALFDSDDPEHLLIALEILDQLGASPAARLVRHKMRRLGVSGIPRGPRAATRSHPAGLTARQVEVLTLLVNGHTNAEIADLLFVSAKTVDHHVSAILTKLDVHSRQEAARIAIDQGLVTLDSA